MLRKFLITTGIFALLLLVFVFIEPAQAQNLTTGLIDAAGESGYGNSASLSSIIGLIINILIGLLGIIFLVLTIYAGFMWMTAAGEAKKVDTAKETLTRAVIGLVIVLSAYAITSFVINTLTNVSTGSSTSGGSGSPGDGGAGSTHIPGTYEPSQ